MIKSKQIIAQTLSLAWMATGDPLYWAYRGDFLISTPEPNYLKKSLIFFYLGVPQTDPDNSAQGAKSKNRLGRPSSGPLGTIHAKDGVCAMISLDFIIRRPFGVVHIF